MSALHDKKIGILGGGQLGKMLIQAASKMGINLHILDASRDFPAAPLCSNFHVGNFKDYQDVYDFGKEMDIISVEIESVNEKALGELEKEGKIVFPQPHLLTIIKDKGSQKQFYEKHDIPTSSFSLYQNGEHILSDVRAGKLSLPFVQKARKEGYDGRGVSLIKNEEDLSRIMDTPSVIEALVEIEKEISVVVARSSKGEIKSFPVVEMDFHPEANLVERLVCPSSLNEEIQVKATEIAENLASTMGIVGLLAVELFLDKDGNILVNEVAPRPHNSGHHTIEACITSQYEQHIRAILGLPLGDTKLINPAVMVNLLGAEGHKGKAYYENMEECLKISGAHIHIYGKEMTKPFRKMGHATILDEDLNGAIKKADFVRGNLRVIAK